MGQPKYSLNDIVVISDESDIEPDLRRAKCQIRDYDADSDEYQLVIIEGPGTGKYIWSSPQFFWSWTQFRLMQTINKDRYQQYMAQIKHANDIRDNIFKQIYGLIPERPDISEFKAGRRVQVLRRAAVLHPWNRWCSDMDATQGLCGQVIETNRLYNGDTGEWEDVVHVEFIIKEIFNDYTYSLWFLPNHLELI